jgi:hypothetical protein
MTIPLNEPLAAGQICWDNQKGFCIIKQIHEGNAATIREISFKEDGSYITTPGSTAFRTQDAQPTTAVLNNKGKWRSRRPISYDIPSPFFFRLKNERSSNGAQSMQFSMAMAYSKFFRYKISPPTPYKKSKHQRWGETLGITHTPLTASWRQARTPQVLPNHRSLMLNITNRELWIGTRAAKAGKVSQQCTLCSNGDESIEHTFVQCPFAQNLRETAGEILRLTLKTAAAVGPIQAIFGPLQQLRPDAKNILGGDARPFAMDYVDSAHILTQSKTQQPASHS